MLEWDVVDGRLLVGRGIGMLVYTLFVDMPCQFTIFHHECLLFLVVSDLAWSQSIEKQSLRITRA